MSSLKQIESHKYNLTGLDQELLFSLIEDKMKEFPELAKKYKNIAFIIANYMQWNEIKPVVMKFSVPAETGCSLNLKPPTPDTILANSDICQKEKKGYVWIVFNNFSKGTKEEQEDTIRHEFCHMVLGHEFDIVMGELCLKYPKRPYDILKVLDSFYRHYIEYQAELCCLKRYPKYWKHFNRPPHKYIDMKSLHVWSRKKYGKIEAFTQGVESFLLFLHYIKRNEYIINEIKPDTVSWFRGTNRRYKRQQKTIIKCIRKDFDINIKKYLNEILFDEKGFLSKMMMILELIGYNAEAEINAKIT